MNINIYLEEPLATQLNRSAKKIGKSRNMIIREAIREWLGHHKTKQWPASVLNFKGIKKITPFEATRSELKPPKEDPFA